MLALVRPESWNLPLFFHVLGATLTFGATATVALLGFAGLRGDPDRAGWLRGLAFWVGFTVLVPAFIMMRGAALWIVDKEYPGGHHEPGWVGVGFIVTEPGALLVIVMVVLSLLAARRPHFRGAVAVPWLASILLVALGIAWFAMSAKPGS
ncbi:MAG: hypothetical protein E6F94_01775 [Actinobacteria bacterium]|nr:MAG: hypothetical protein E6F94_01775 [Actinomycetota bacterium]